MAVSSPFFNGMSIQEQKELVMEIMPENIKFNVLWLLLNKNLFQTFTIPENLQSLLDDAVFYFERQNGVKALEATRKCVSLQFRNFLIANELDTDDHKISSRIVRFLVKTDNRDRFLSERLSTSWAKLEQVYTSTYEDDYKLDEIMEILTSAETFCNNIYSIRKKKSFKRDDLLNWLTESLMVEGQRYNSSANIRTILQEQLANKFQKIELKKPKLTVSDQTFIGLPDQKRKGLILNLLSENIREVIELETKCDYFEANKMLKRVQLKEEVIDDKFETPQSLLDDAAFYVEREQDFPAFKAAWKCINLQLDNFLLANEVVADEKQTVRFLQKYHTDKEFTYVWTLFEAQHRR
uniref:DNA repair protein n=1 Tax=Meloidogyne hapla TaxID=6305 RepID=A0A1I8C3M1_MELHA